ncbi:MAG: DEAD/DEAH box helicase, partial [Candidatus Hydrogenedentota bacterium]
LKGSEIEVRPEALNEGESRFVTDLRAYHDAHPDEFKDRELYLLRNRSRGHGVGFFEAGNFHPDFILWLVTGDYQTIIFVDPKGIHHLSPDDPKIVFHKTIKEIEERMKDRKTRLEAFIISRTPAHEMEKKWGIKKAEMLKRHILFQDDGAEECIGALMEAAGK